MRLSKCSLETGSWSGVCWILALMSRDAGTVCGVDTSRSISAALNGFTPLHCLKCVGRSILSCVVSGNGENRKQTNSSSCLPFVVFSRGAVPTAPHTVLHLPADPLARGGGRGTCRRDIIESLECRLDHPFPPRLFVDLTEIEAGVELDARPDGPRVDVVQL